MSFFEIPDNPVFCTEIKKLEVTDRAHADIFNEITKKLLHNEVFIKKQLDNLDCGHFLDGITVETHNSTPYTHGNIVADGGIVSITEGCQDISLEAHLVDEHAHQNIILDGNES